MTEHSNVLAGLLGAALERRRAGIDALEASGTDCYRLFDGFGDGRDGMVIEIFGPVAILQEHQGRFLGDADDIRSIAHWLVRAVPAVKSVYSKRFVPDRTSVPEEDSNRSATPLVGEPAAPVVTARENGMAFQIRPYDGYSVGIFLDQRENRRALTESLPEGAAVLNLFAYTGGFSVYAAKRGAQTDTIDLSRRYLDWAKENFVANGIAVEGHRFFADNATTFLRRGVNRPKRYDLIVLDPPSFSRSKEGLFRVRDHLPALVDLAAKMLKPGGRLFVSSNHEAWPEAVFTDEIGDVAHGAGLKPDRLPQPPFDFANSAEPLRAVLWQAP